MKSYCILEKDGVVVKELEGVISTIPGLCALGVRSDLDSGFNLILSKKPGLVFINLDNFSDNPFLLVNELHQYLNEIPKVIGLSKGKHLAYEAIKHGFIDYLILPLRELDVRKAALKYLKQFSMDKGHSICLKSYNDYQFLNTSDILFLKADNNTTDFYMKNGEEITAFKTLKTFHKSLPKNFLRVHKSYIINQDFISRINFGKQRCYLKHCIEGIPFSKSYAEDLKLLNHQFEQKAI